MDHWIDSPHIDVDVVERTHRGGGGWQLKRNQEESWAWADVFTPEECDSIIEIGCRNGLVAATTRGSDTDSRRNSSVVFLYPNLSTEWIFQKLTEAVTTTNQFFGFDLTHMMEGIQFTEYHAPGQNYNWHADCGPLMATRKLSLTVQLTDPNNYKGGELELNAYGDAIEMDKVRGRAFAFPSWTLHRVKPVTEGVRHSLVVWVTGPPFR
jgi:PKHD-type hydroxylase